MVSLTVEDAPMRPHDGLDVWGRPCVPINPDLARIDDTEPEGDVFGLGSGL